MFGDRPHLLGTSEPAELRKASELLLLDDPELAKSIGNAGRMCVEQEFSWPRTVDGYEDAFCAALSA